MQTFKEIFSLNLITILGILALTMAAFWNHWVFWFLAAVSVTLITAAGIFTVGLALQGRLTSGASLKEAARDLVSEIKSFFIWSNR
jgi:hypothetical protein